MIDLFDYQKSAISELRTGSILRGGVGSGKSLTAIAYFYIKDCGGSIDKDLYIITTARKRDSQDWESECAHFNIEPKAVDSWNNVSKYAEIRDAFFIFDEQKVIGSGAWVKAFLKIAKANHWILLTATPGDTWMDYIPVFIANGFYKNRTEFIRRHVVYNNFTKFPKVDHYIETDLLEKLKRKVLVQMKYVKKTVPHHEDIVLPYDKELFDKAYIKRWNPYENRPIKEIGEAGYLFRKIVNTDISRLNAVRRIAEKHRKIIVFYNFDYELEALRTLEELTDFTVAEYNGHLHSDIPTTQNWIYLVQYMSGAEAWNCITTNVVVFFSRNYSYRLTIQAAGRIDRQNTPFQNLYYYYLTSESPIDQAIAKALKSKKSFNERRFLKQIYG